MIHKKILVVTTYPITNPQHGGQKRTKAIVDIYSSVFSEVKSVAIFHSKYFPEHSNNDISIKDPALIKKVEASPYNGDILTAENLLDDKQVKDEVTSLLLELKPDIIDFEQVYSYMAIEKILKLSKLKPKIILSSQNIEYSLKKTILKSLGKLDVEAREAVERLRIAEEKIAKEADLVIAVSDSDSKELKKMGAKKVLLAPNGIEKITPTKEALEHWKNFKLEKNVERSVVFVGSAHPPNLHGFTNLIGTDLSFLPEDSSIMLAGGISTYLEQEFPASTKDNGKLWSKAYPLGRISDDNLAGIIEESEVIVLPILEGGGSNLKTAEAILSGKKIVATDHAFRGFDNYLNLPNIYIANSKAGFKKMIIKALDEPYVERSPKEIILAESVQWSYSLKPLRNGVGIMSVGRFRFYINSILESLRKIAHKLKQSLAKAY